MFSTHSIGLIGWSQVIQNFELEWEFLTTLKIEKDIFSILYFPEMCPIKSGETIHLVIFSTFCFKVPFLGLNKKWWTLFALQAKHGKIKILSNKRKIDTEVGHYRNKDRPMMSHLSSSASVCSSHVIYLGATCCILTFMSFFCKSGPFC